MCADFKGERKLRISAKMRIIGSTDYFIEHGLRHQIEVFPLDLSL